jgi:hypothetical protein
MWRALCWPLSSVNGGGDATKDGGVVLLQKEMRLV